jgi:beta-glucosidase
VLAGDYNPAGRLPVTFYQSVDQLPPFDDYAMAGRTYRFFTGQPLYRFGYGLSYSRFRYSGFLWRKPLATSAPHAVSARVSNASARDGDEVVQLYLAVDGGMPALAAFQRVHIAAGASVLVRFTLNTDTVRLDG